MINTGFNENINESISGSDDFKEWCAKYHLKYLPHDKNII